MKIRRTFEINLSTLLFYTACQVFTIAVSTHWVLGYIGTRGYRNSFQSCIAKKQTNCDMGGAHITITYRDE